MAMIALALGLTLAACGRKGGMDPPPGAQLTQPANTEQRYDAEGRPLAPTGEKKRLPMDWLLD